uniref:Uncharacterized protein n=1 Tax=Siphoviridae sp. ct2vX3 TaxID=2825318 RepID=A0A8S5PX83_9CAUD|nr:MAG TPA: hypothetical protein [Siphoviridae sp. ct2vX3]
MKELRLAALMKMVNSMVLEFLMISVTLLWRLETKENYG